jgi:hypothetical protein
VLAICNLTMLCLVLSRAPQRSRSKGGIMRAFTVIVGVLCLVGSANAQELRAYPDKMLTPGSIDPSLTPEYICSHSTSERRSVNTSLKKSVFAAYNIPFEDRADYEVDHFIPLALGGVKHHDARYEHHHESWQH